MSLLAVTTPAIVRVTCISDEPGFMALRSEWNRLAAEAPQNSLFLRHEWFDAAWQWRKHDARLHLLCAYRDAELVGVLPLIAHQTRHARTQVGALALLTVPDTQFCDMLVSGDSEAEVAEAFAAYLTADNQAWDVASFSYLPPSARITALLPQALARLGLRHGLSPAGTNPYISLEGAWEDFYATRGRRLKKSNNLVANRLKKQGELEIEWLRGPVDEAQISNSLGIITEISARSWKEVTGRTLENPAPGAFIRRLTELANERGWLSLWLLRLAGKPIAMEYQLIYGGNVHALRADFDNTYRDFSPGSYLNWKLLEQSFGNGLLRYYMGPGENPYKLRWTEEALPLERLTVYSPSLRGRWAALHDRHLAPLARRLTTRLARHKHSTVQNEQTSEQQAKGNES